MKKGFRVALIIIAALNGFAGLVCGVLLIARPDGSLMAMQTVITMLQAFPFADVFFKDLFWVGIAMFLALGVPNAAACILLLKKNRMQYIALLIAAILLLLWCVTELLFIPNPAVIVYSGVGVFQVIAAILLTKYERQIPLSKVGK